MPRLSSLARTCLSGFIACLILLDAVYAQPRAVNLQLLWNHQFQFAGFYAAEAVHGEMMVKPLREADRVLASEPANGSSAWSAK
jgi:hypothetical protein